MSAPTELRRDWFFTPGAEWITWQDPHTNKWKAIRVILTPERRFLEWTADSGFVAGASDDGDAPGRAKMSPVLIARPGVEQEVGQQVLETIAGLRKEPPTFNGHPVHLPPGLLDFLADQILHMPARSAGPT
jgi:hypothetical protein